MSKALTFQEPPRYLELLYCKSRKWKSKQTCSQKKVIFPAENCSGTKCSCLIYSIRPDTAFKVERKQGKNTIIDGNEFKKICCRDEIWELQSRSQYIYNPFLLLSLK